MSTGKFPVNDYSRDNPEELDERVRNPGDPDGVVAAEARKRWQQTHPAPRTERTYKQRRVWPTVVVVTVVLVVAAFGSYWLGNHQAHQKQGSGAQTAGQPNSQAEHSNQPAQPTA